MDKRGLEVARGRPQGSGEHKEPHVLEVAQRLSKIIGSMVRSLHTDQKDGWAAPSFKWLDLLGGYQVAVQVLKPLALLMVFAA